MKMILLVGLGNPGVTAKHQRHNVGWQALDLLARKFKATDWRRDGQADVARGKNANLNSWLLMPLTFMNASGGAVKKFIRQHRIPVDRLWVIHDDLDLPFGAYRISLNRGSAGHRGVQSLIDTLGTKNFGRLRVGIGSNRDHQLPAEAYVLQDFTPAESEALPDILKTAADNLLAAIHSKNDKKAARSSNRR